MPRCVDWVFRHPWITAGAVVATSAVGGAMVGAALEIVIQHRKARKHRRLA